MKLWDYLKAKMSEYGNRVAFAKSGITYAELCLFGGKTSGGGKLTLCEGETREALAYGILKCIAAGNVAVPVTAEYGQRKCDAIRNTVQADENRYPDLAAVMFTSGTTGAPKGVMLTDENIIANLECIFGYFDVSRATRVCIARSPTHISVLTGELLYALCNGLTISFYEERYSPQRLLSFLREQKAEVFCATPTIFLSLFRCAQSDASELYRKWSAQQAGEWTHLRCTSLKNSSMYAAFPVKICAVSGEILAEEIARMLSDTFPLTEFYHVYGLTEHSPRVCALLPREFNRKAGSIGKPLSGVQLTIENGELLVRSPCVMRGYYKDKTATYERLAGGWLHTGDAAYRDEEGYYYILGRKDDMIIRAGVNVYPQEIESEVMRCEGVQDCVVFGEKDLRFGQKIVLHYVGACEASVLKKALRERLSPYAIPDRIMKADQLETTESGKKSRRQPTK